MMIQSRISLDLTQAPVDDRVLSFCLCAIDPLFNPGAIKLERK